MRVLFVSNDPTIFDPASVARARMRSYAEQVKELTIISPAPFGVKGGQEGNLTLHPVVTPKLLRIIAMKQKAHEIILARGIDIVSAQDPFEQGYAAYRAVMGTGAKLHIQVHTDFLSPWFVRGGNWWSSFFTMALLNRYRLKLADHVLPAAGGIRVVSERVKVSLMTRFGSRIVEPTVIPVPVDQVAPPSTPLPPHSSFSFSLITVGRLEPEKRIEDILAALKLVVERYPMVGLFIVGKGRERKLLERMVRRFGLTDKVIFLGERRDARALMASAQICIQASAYEGYSRTLVEAALARVPIVTTDVGIVGEVFKGHEEVLAVPVADPTALSLAIVRVIEDKAMHRQLVLRAEEAARAHLVAAGDITTRVAEDLSRTRATV